MSPRLAFALEAAHRAGRLTLAHFQTGAEVETKSDGSPVTIADRSAERLIREMIAARYPGEAILGEEEGETPGSEDRKTQNAKRDSEDPIHNPQSAIRNRTGWVIDPIDGTKSFICGVPLYATLLSCEEDGQAVIGVCYFPGLDEMVYAEKGQGAFWNGRPCRVSQVSSLKDAFLSSGSQFSMEKAGRSRGFEKLVQSSRATRTWTDAYGHALVATGRVEAMVDPIVAPWDISAMALIVREAGGCFTDFQGDERPQTEAIASNGLLHDALLEAFRE